MNATEYRALHGRKVQECTWCGKDTGHKARSWCEGSRCMASFIAENPPQPKPPTRKPRGNGGGLPAYREAQGLPENWGERWQDSDAAVAVGIHGRQHPEALGRTLGGVEYIRSKVTKPSGAFRVFRFEHASRFQRVVSGHGSRWSEDDDCDLLSLKSSGFGYKRLTEHFPGRTRDAIRSRWRELQGQGRGTRRQVR